MELNDVASWYESILGREADPEGLNYWESQLSSGADPNAVMQSFFQGAAQELQRDDSGLTPETDAWDQQRFINSMNSYYFDEPRETAQGTSYIPALSKFTEGKSFYDFWDDVNDLDAPASERLAGLDVAAYQYQPPPDQAATGAGGGGAVGGGASGGGVSGGGASGGGASGGASGTDYAAALRGTPYRYSRTNVGTDPMSRRLMGPGTADYSSALIRSLRANSAKPFSSNRGIDLIGITGGPSGSINPQAATTSSALAFNPTPFAQTPATSQEVADRQAYDAYRLGTLDSKNSGPLLSFDEWQRRQANQPTSGFPLPSAPYNGAIFAEI